MKFTLLQALIRRLLPPPPPYRPDYEMDLWTLVEHNEREDRNASR